MNLLAIEKSEGPKVLLAWLMGVCVTLGTVLGWASIQAMLLKRVGVEFLPYTYIGLGVLGMLGSSLYLVFADAVRRDRLLIRSSIGLALVLLAARLLVASGPPVQEVLSWKPVLFFLIVFGVLMLSTSIVTGQLWTIINDVFRPSRGRSLYPLLHSSGAVGGILGGILVQLLTPLTGTPNLVIAWALSYLLVALLIVLFRNRYGGELRGISRHLPGIIEKPGIWKNVEEGWRFVNESTLLKLLSLLTIFVWLVTGLLDFQFSRIMDATFPSEESLSRFYGGYAIGLNTTILAIQAGLSGWIIRHTGVSRCLTALPLTGLAGFGLIAVSFSFIPGLLMRSTWEVVGQTIRTSAFQLILNAAPGTLRARARGFLDGVVNPLTGILSGSIILLMRWAIPPGTTVSGLDLITLAGMVFCIAWFFVVQKTRRQYILAVIANLGSRDRQTLLDSVELLEERSSPVAFQKLLEVAQSNDKEAIMAALATLSRIGKLSALRVVSQIMNSDDEDLRASSVRAASGFDRIRRHPLLKFHFIRRMEKIFMEDPSAPVRAEAARFLIKYHSREEMPQRVHKMLQHPDPMVRCKVIETLADLKEDFFDFFLEDMIDDPVPAVRASAIEALWKVPERKARIRDALESLLLSDSFEAHAAALKTTVRLGASQYGQMVGPFLDSPVPLVQALAALAVLAVTEEGNPAWERAVQNLTVALSDPARAEEMHRDVLPLLPHLKPNGLDAVLMGVAVLPSVAQQNAAGVLQDLHGILTRHLAVLK
ncbi:MAG: HEAT repeat domain-containing protein [Desulfobacteraceae bacterium]|nr:HEAT repeat domain-containing protein [Desulfobacteraceae bacterium]